MKTGDIWDHGYGNPPTVIYTCPYCGRDFLEHEAHYKERDYCHICGSIVEKEEA